MKRRAVLWVLSGWIIAIGLLSCSKPDPVIPVGRTVFVYMAADNTLSDIEPNSNLPYPDLNINEMEKGMKAAKSVDGRLVCLIDKKDTPTQLIEVTAQGRRVLKEYGVNINTALPETFRATLADVQALAPAQSYGLILWSHGSGWLPVDATRSALTDETIVRPVVPTAFPLRPLPNENSALRAFGQDHDVWMTTDDMAKALPDNGFDFIIFDACYMASIELMYALRHKTPLFVVSPTEILAVGFPYATIIDPLFASAATVEQNMTDVCQLYFDFYKNQPDESSRSASIALIRTAHLESLASKMKQLNIDLSRVAPSSVQRFNRQSVYPLYDFTDAYLKAQGTEGSVAWGAEIGKVVPFTRHSDYFLSLRIATCCGLSSYIPVASRPATNSFYQQTAWYKDTH